MAGALARLGKVATELPSIPTDFANYACRNNRLLLCALEQIRQPVEAALTRYGRARIGVVLGSSTSGMAEGETAFAALKADGKLPAAYRYLQQEVGMPAVFLARYLGLTGPAYTVCTACTSSAKAFASARSLLRHNLCDAVLVGGVDSLCKLTINGFASLESTTTELTNPMSRNRRGINIGEGAALFLMTREPSAVELLGVGEASDAYHMTAPHPQGLGAQAAMHAALDDARLRSEDVDYLNLHATGTQKNDEMESWAVDHVFPHKVLTSGTKPMTGHTLGAAGATELAICWLALAHKQLPAHVWDAQADAHLPSLNFVTGSRTFSRTTGRVCMSNSFAFGGSNASLLVGDAR